MLNKGFKPCPLDQIVILSSVSDVAENRDLKHRIKIQVVPHIQWVSHSTFLLRLYIVYTNHKVKYYYLYGFLGPDKFERCIAYRCCLRKFLRFHNTHYLNLQQHLTVAFRYHLFHIPPPQALQVLSGVRFTFADLSLLILLHANLYPSI